MRRLHATTITGFTVGLLAGMTSCVTPPPADPYSQENVFLQDRPPRYGHGGTQSPGTAPRAYQPPPGYDASQFSRSRDGTIFLPSQPQPAPPRSPSSPGSGAGTAATQPPPSSPSGAASGPGDAPPTFGDPSAGSPGGGSTGPAGESGTGPSVAGTGPGASGGTSPTSPGSGAPEAVAPASTAPFGIPVPGKAGYVYSPFDEKKRYVDVTDIAAGTEVKCPYTQKIFKVP